MLSFLLEQPLRLGGTLVVLWVAAGVVWWITQQSWWKKVTVFGVPTIVVLLGLNLFVVTEREDLLRFMNSVITDVTQQRLSGLMNHIDSDYNFEGVTYDMLSSKISRSWKKYKFTNVQILKWSYERKEAGEYDIQFACKAFLLVGGYPYAVDKTEWKFRVIKDKEKQRWLVTQITPIEFTSRSSDQAGVLTLKNIIRSFR